MSTLEKEQRYLLNSLPVDIDAWDSEFLADTYIPETSDNPQIRLRQRGGKCFITKKYPLKEGDLSTMVEETINLSRGEYDHLKQSVPGRYLAKTRYKKVFGTYTVEIDQYLDNLAPLMVLDIEWSDVAPDTSFIGKFDIRREITQAKSLAAGRIAGKEYSEIAQYIV